MQEAGLRRFDSADSLREAVGTQIGVSGWLAIDQARIDGFAAVSGDDQWIHVDVERAASGPFGCTIAHGYLTLSLVVVLWRQIFKIDNVAMAVNYGLNKVRFPSPVPVNSRVRLRLTLAGVETLSANEVQLTWGGIIEREGAEKPACVLENVSRVRFVAEDVSGQ